MTPPLPKTAGNPVPAPNSPDPQDNPALRANRELDAYSDVPYGSTLQAETEEE